MKIHSFAHNAWATGEFFMGAAKNTCSPREELLVLGAAQGDGLGVAIRLQRGDGVWLNFGRVKGFELTVMGAYECSDMVEVLKELIKEVEAQARGEQVERKTTDFSDPACPREYLGHEDVEPKDFVRRADYGDFILAGDEE